MNKKTILIVVLVVVFVVIAVVVYMFSKSNTSPENQPKTITTNTSNTGVSNLINQQGFSTLLSGFIGKK